MTRGTHDGRFDFSDRPLFIKARGNHDYDVRRLVRDPAVGNSGWCGVMTGPIVVGVDGSEASCRAAQLGRLLSDALSTPLHLLAVGQNTALELAAIRADVDLAGLYEAVVDTVATNARSALEEVLPAEVIDATLVCRIGRVEQVLTEFAVEVGAALVVLGGQTHSPLAHWFHRGTAQLLIRKSEIPLIVTAPEPTDDTIRRIILALDLSRMAPRVIEFGRRLAGVLDVELQAIHVVEDVPLAIESPSRIPVDAVREAHARAVTEQLEPLLPDGLSVDMKSGPVRERIAEALAAEPGTMVVVGSRGLGAIERWLLGSTTTWLLDQLPGAVAVVPEPEDSS